MSWRADLLASYPESMQKQALIRSALSTIDQALMELGSLGHVLHIAPGATLPAAPEFPKRLFSVTVPEGRLVYSQSELDALTADWFPSLDEARFAKGLQRQWLRGGFFYKALPDERSLRK